MVAQNRIRPFLKESLSPLLENAYESRSPTNGERSIGSTALIVAHANSLRALIGVLCNVENDPSGLALSKLESMKISTASPLVIQFQKTVDEGIYFPVDCNALREDGVRNELPVYPLSSLPVLKKQQQTNLDQAEMPSSLVEAVPIK